VILLSKKILVTGGAGFIGSHIVDKLISLGHEVRILDILNPQVHPNENKPIYLNKNAEFVKGDVGNIEVLKIALEGIEVIYHEAAVVGLTQSMNEITKFVKNNTQATAVLLNYIVNKENEIKKIIVASSVALYGEGLYKNDSNFIEPPFRPQRQLNEKKWELENEKGEKLEPIPTPESKKQNYSSVYGLTKKTQEELVLMVGKEHGISSIALRYFNVFGPRQSIINPYSGVVTLFLNQISSNKSPQIYEDGLQTRDFISVHDIVEANILAMNAKNVTNEAFNVGSGNPVSVNQICKTLLKLTSSKIEPTIINQHRKGDIRHCFADITKIKNKLGFKPKFSFESTSKEVINWIALNNNRKK